MSLSDVERLTINTPVDVERARRVLRAFASNAGLPPMKVEELVLAASELVGNLVKHSASDGVLTCSLRNMDDRVLVEVRVQDLGPGIPDLPLAMEDGFSTKGSLGSGLPGARRLVDSFHIESSPAGTTIWLGKRIPTS